MPKLRKKDSVAIDECVKHFDEHRHLFDGFARSVHDSFKNDPQLAPFIHFIKYRLKSSPRLREKLEKKRRARARPEITAHNIFQHINDLAGVRVLHLHLNQIGDITKHIKRVLDAAKIRIVEGPIAKVWDQEYEGVFNKLGIETEKSDSMYTSVHYVLEANEKTKITFELQVRTLAEELWGEISHKVSYEEEEPLESISDQLKVLARMTSGTTRLVDCIVRTFLAAKKTRVVSPAGKSKTVTARAIKVSARRRTGMRKI